MIVFWGAKINKINDYTKRTVPFVELSTIIRNFAALLRRIVTAAEEKG